MYDTNQFNDTIYATTDRPRYFFIGVGLLTSNHSFKSHCQTTIGFADKQSKTTLA